MRFLVFCLMLFATPLAAQDSNTIENTITGQLEAFVARDVDAAFEYASPMIQSLFQSPENFGQMVQSGYPMVWDNAEVRFLELRDINGNLWQRVMIRDGAGAIHMLDYQMVELPAGWRINGVEILPAPDVGA